MTACAPAGWRRGGTLPLVAHVAVNWAKFGSLLSVPGDRQMLSLQDPRQGAWFRREQQHVLLDALSHHHDRALPPSDAIRFERLIPGVRFGPVAENRASYPLLGNTSASSLTVTATLLWCSAVVGVVWLLRHRARTWLLVVSARRSAHCRRSPSASSLSGT